MKSTPTSATIGWAVTAAGIAFYAASASSLIGTVGPMARIASSLGAALPWHTLMCLKIGDPLLGILPVILLAIPILVLLGSKSPRWRIAVPVVSTAIVVLYIVMAKDGIRWPVEQLGEALK